MVFEDRARATVATYLTFFHSVRGLAGLAVDRSGAKTQRVALEWGKAMAKHAGVETEIHGLRPELFDAPVIVMANHASHFDIPILLSVLPRCPGFLAKKELFDFPVFGPAMKGIHCIPIDRADRKQSLDAIEKAAGLVREGGRLVVFPEGTRGNGKQLRTLKKGPFHLVQRARVPIVPVGLTGTAAVCPRDNFKVYPGKVTIRFGEPITFAPERPQNLAAERRVIMERVADSLSALSGLPRGAESDPD
jgi:1-acyl-sn-glycerol-3-phosphate acyltransferase